MDAPVTIGQVSSWFHERGYDFTAHFDNEDRFYCRLGKAGSHRVDLTYYAPQGEPYDRTVERLIAAVRELESGLP